ncbi:TPA: hypothetical protein NKW06_003669 [Vibrio parahaemolyticus]|nr:hypothetical protein [Vibrio parahaemolyticus]HCM1282092.1 hypothetical protein [Vibrio parahaemolyticus]
MNNVEAFFTPTQLFNHLKEERTGDADPWWNDWPSLFEQEQLAKNLIDQGTLHRAVYIGDDFVDLQGENHNFGLYGTSCVVPFSCASECLVLSLFDSDGNEIPLTGGIRVQVDGYNATSYSVEKYVAENGLGRIETVKRETMPEKGASKPTINPFTPQKQDLRDFELIAELMLITETSEVKDAVEQIKRNHEELSEFKEILNRSQKFRDVYELLILAQKGQFNGITQGTKHDVNGRGKQTVVKIINNSHENLSATDSYFIAKMISEVR